MTNKTKFATSLNAQRKRLYDALAERGGEGLTTIYAREELDIMMPAARIYELRHEHGHNIQLIFDKDTNAQGNTHSCGRYVLLTGKWKGAKAA